MSCSDSDDMEGSLDSDDNSDYDDIRPFFKPEVFAKLPFLLKKGYRSQKDRYEEMLAKGHSITAPVFMRPPEPVKKRGSGKKTSGKRCLSSSDSGQGSSSGGSLKKSRKITENDLDDPNCTVTIVRHSKRVEGNKLKAAAQSTSSNCVNHEISDDENDFPTIKPYFSPSEWKTMSLLVKNHALKAKDAYDEKIKKGQTPNKPKFMQQANDNSNSSTLCTEKSPKNSQESIPQMTESLGDDDEGNPFQDLDNFLDSHRADDKQMHGGTTEDSTSSDRDLLDEIKNFIVNILPKIGVNIVDKMSQKLIELGAESLEDLAHVSAPSLMGFGLKELHINKLLNAFSSQNKENVPPKSVPPNQKKKTKKLPLLKEAPLIESISSRPNLADKVTDTGVLGYSITWGNMRDSLLISLEKGERPKPTDRENMVYEISKDIKKAYLKVREENPTIKQKTPGRPVYKAITEAIFKDFKDSFEDTLAGKVVGDGMFSLKDQFETCIENMFREHNRGSEKTTPVKGNRSASCILADMFAPTLTKVQKLKAEETRLQLTALYKSPSNWDWDLIKTKMNDQCTIGAQRALINHKKRDMNVIIEHWPFLFEYKGLINHLEKITGQESFLSNFETFVADELDDYINYLTIESPKRIRNLKIKNALASATGVHQSFMGLIQMLCNHFEEDFSLLVRCAEEGTLPSEIPDMEELPLTPLILALGCTVFDASEYLICMNHTCIGHSIDNCTEAIMAVTAAYFVFGVLYPNNASTTLTFIERIIANLSDDSGLVKATTSKGAAATSVVRKLQVLSQDKERFVKEFDC